MIKTLKEVEHPKDIEIASIRMSYNIELRQIAIKWIKNLESYDLDNAPKEWEDYYNREFENPCEVVAWIKMFFNIQEEDLR